MVEPVTISTFLAAAFAGVVGNRADSAVCGLGEIIGKLRQGIDCPENQDIALVVRRSAFDAAKHTLQDYIQRSRAEWQRNPVDEPRLFCERAGDYFKKTDTEFAGALDANIEASILYGQDSATTKWKQAAETLFLDHLRKELGNVRVPESFETYFRSDSGWFGNYSDRIREQVSTNDRFRNILTITQISGLVTGQERMEDRLGGIDDKLALLLQGQCLNKDQVQGLLETFGHSGLPIERAEQALLAEAKRLKEMQARLAHLDIQYPNISACLDEARTALEEGQIDTALKIIVEAQQQGQVRESIRQIAALRAEEAQIHALKFDYCTSARLFGEAAAIIHDSDPHQRWEYLSLQAKSLYVLGEQFGHNEALKEAILLCRHSALSLVDQQSMPEDWAETMNIIANALCCLGEREEGCEHLNAAVDICDELLTVLTCDQFPIQWATAQNNLGNALSELGVRKVGTDGLVRAIDSYQAALTIFSRDNFPDKWARLQANLGAAFLYIGEREQETDNLEAAVDACHLALEVHTRERFPVAWCLAQHNLGHALKSLALREDSTVKLEAAIAAFRAALEVRSRERHPMQWANTQCGLGAALGCLGQRKPEIGILNASAAAYNSALEVYDHAQCLDDWRIAQTGLGAALLNVGEIEEGTESLIAAVAAFRSVLRESVNGEFRPLVISQAIEYAENLILLRSMQSESVS